MKTDDEIVSDIQQDLKYGAVSLAKESLNGIQDAALKQEISEVIRQYESDFLDYY